MKLLLDNCIINKLVEDNETFSKLKELKECVKAELYICYSVIEEINSIPDEKKEKRVEMLNSVFSLELKVLKDEPAVFDTTRFDLSDFSDGEVYKNILSMNKDNIRDAIHAQTAVSNRLTLVTEDKKLLKAMKHFGYEAYDLSELYDYK